jgi:hypothetical protein
MPLNRPEAQSMVMNVIDQMAKLNDFTRDEIIKSLWREKVQEAICESIMNDRILEARR